MHIYLRQVFRTLGLTPIEAATLFWLSFSRMETARMEEEAEGVSVSSDVGGHVGKAVLRYMTEVEDTIVKV